MVFHLTDLWYFIGHICDNRLDVAMPQKKNRLEFTRRLRAFYQLILPKFAGIKYVSLEGRILIIPLVIGRGDAGSHVLSHGISNVKFVLNFNESKYETRTLFTQTNGQPDSVFWDGKSFVGLLFRVLSIPYITVHISFLNLERIRTRVLKPAEKAKSAQLQIANELGVLAISKKQ